MLIFTSIGGRGTPEQIRDAVAQRAQDGADVIKIFASASIRDGGRPTMSQEQLNAAVDEARRHGLRTAVQTIAHAMYGVFEPDPHVYTDIELQLATTADCMLVRIRYLGASARGEGATAIEQMLSRPDVAYE